MNKILNWILIIILGLYILSPLDFIPDVIPVIGWIDDLGALIMLLGLLRENFKGGKRYGN